MALRVKEGDFVIVQKWKRSTSPSPRAQETFPAQSGDTYSYRIDKYWKVVHVLDDHTLEIETRRGKRHVVDVNEVQMRKARFWDRLLDANRFF